MKEDIRKQCKTCATYMLHKLENVKFERKVFKPSLQPMDFICMDLIDEFHPPISHGHHYALTVVCMLTGFTWCIPLKTKTAEKVSKAYARCYYLQVGGVGLFSLLFLLQLCQRFLLLWLCSNVLRLWGML